ncbi:unnamed protein product [Brassica rapa subsp. trilocularis]
MVAALPREKWKSALRASPTHNTILVNLKRATTKVTQKLR